MLIPPEILEFLGPISPLMSKWVTPFFEEWFLPIFNTWWWLPLPFLLKDPFLYLWRRWRKDIWYGKQDFTLLEIRIPKEILKPIKAMERVFDGFWMLYDPANPREKWIDGKLLLCLSLEIVGLGGETHFFIRIPTELRHMFESDIYSQYPEVEISEVEDYTKLVPQNIPNKDWDLWACDYKNEEDDPYPLRTYKEFETGTEAKEEKRVDPMAALLEGVAKLKEGEQLWIQMVICPITPKENDWVERGKKIRDELVKRPKKPSRKPIIQEAVEVLITGKPPEVAPPEEKELIPPEMRLTPGEREIVEGIEGKISKYGFETNIRFIYLAKRDIFFKPNLKLPMGFLNAFSTLNLNRIKPWGKTITKRRTFFTWFLDERMVYLRKRKIFRNYVDRNPPLYPLSGGTFVLNTEELASLYHFPSGVVAPAPFVPRIEAKKAEAPPSLPTE